MMSVDSLDPSHKEAVYICKSTTGLDLYIMIKSDELKGSSHKNKNFSLSYI